MSKKKQILKVFAFSLYFVFNLLAIYTSLGNAALIGYEASNDWT